MISDEISMKRNIWKFQKTRQRQRVYPELMQATTTFQISIIYKNIKTRCFLMLHFQLQKTYIDLKNVSLYGIHIMKFRKSNIMFSNSSFIFYLCNIKDLIKIFLNLMNSRVEKVYSRISKWFVLNIHTSNSCINVNLVIILNFIESYSKIFVIL